MTKGNDEQPTRLKAKRLDLRAVWARWAVRATTTRDPWAVHVCDFYRRLLDQETHYGER